jgi:hypothetical protein
MTIEDLNKLQAFIDANALDREVISTKESDYALCIAYRFIEYAEEKAEIKGMEASRKLLSNTIIKQL